jgi:hypothetical protein
MIYLYLFSKNKVISNNGFVDIESQQNKIKSVILKIPKFILIYIIEWLPYLTISIYVHYKNLNENVLFGVLLFAIICIMIGGFVFSNTYKKNLPK